MRPTACSSDASQLPEEASRGLSKQLWMPSFMLPAAPMRLLSGVGAPCPSPQARQVSGSSPLHHLTLTPTAPQRGLCPSSLYNSDPWAGRAQDQGAVVWGSSCPSTSVRRRPTVAAPWHRQPPVLRSPLFWLAELSRGVPWELFVGFQPLPP